MSGILVYNLFPRLIGKFEDMKTHVERAKNMGFEYIYLNPVASSGFSGSSYAIKDYYLYNPMHLKGWPLLSEDYEEANLLKNREQAEKNFKELVKFCEILGLKVMIDLVINHTAMDSPLTKEHKNWYKKDEKGEILNPGVKSGKTYIKWGDLAEIDNESSEDIEGLWKYWEKLLSHYLDLGIKGFRCDAAYKVPPKLWEFLIKGVKQRDSSVVFLGETLGCTPKELIEIGDCGFDILMNSFKWWNFKDKWFLEDYNTWSKDYSSLIFPENHDTLRFAKEHGVNKNKAIFTYALQSYFCSSIAITLGFEYGFTQKIDVVTTNPTDMEIHKYDLTKEITLINNLKSKYNIFKEDNFIEEIKLGDNIFAFIKKSKDEEETLVVIANLDEHNYTRVEYFDFYQLFSYRRVQDLSLGHKMEAVPNNFEYYLNPFEIKVFYSKKYN